MPNLDHESWRETARKPLYFLTLGLVVWLEPACTDDRREDGSMEAAPDTLDASRASDGPSRDAGAEAPELARDGGASNADAPPAGREPDAATPGDAPDTRTEVVRATADYIFPDESLSDWVSYAEHLAVVTVIREERIPPPKEVEERGEGYIGRRISLRVDETIWRNDGAAPLPGAFDMLVWGWILRNRALFVATSAEVARMYPEGRYIVPLLKLSTGEFAPLTSRSILALPSSSIAVDDIARHGQSMVARSLSHLSSDELRSVLAMTPRDPAAVARWDLPPDERVRAVLAGQREETD